MHKEGDEIEVGCTKYVALPEPSKGLCSGCAGQFDGNVCIALPVGCSTENIIWVRNE